MFILFAAQKWKCKQVDYELAALHESLEDDVYLDMPRGFQQPTSVLKLLKSCMDWSRVQGFFETFEGKFFSQEFRQSTNDPCLFFRGNRICVVYVDDCLFLAETNEVINEAEI